MKLIKGERYRLNRSDSCYKFCKDSVCVTCELDSIGEYTGNSWLDSDGSILHEFLYYKQGKKVVGIFTDNHIVFKLK